VTVIHIFLGTKELHQLSVAAKYGRIISLNNLQILKQLI